VSIESAAKALRVMRKAASGALDDLKLRLAAAIKAGDVVEQQRIRVLLDRVVGPKAEKETR